MKRFFFFAALLLTTGALGSSAQAQTTSTMSVTINGDVKDTKNTIYINDEDCRKNAKIEVNLKLAGLSGTPMFLEVWESGAAASCNAEAGRSKPSSGGSAPCELILQKMNPVVGGENIPLPVRDLFGDGNSTTCTETGTRNIYFVPVTSKSNPELSTGNPPSLSGAVDIKLSVLVDVQGPAAPEDVKSSNGESEIGAKWDASGERDTLEYKVYFDVNAISKADTNCSSALLVPGKAITDEEQLQTRTVNKTLATVDPADLDMSVGEQIPIAVAAVDAAGNEGPLSEVVCASMVSTDGFLDRNGGAGLDSCAVSPGRERRAADLGMVLLAMIGAGLLVRRRLS